jgi:hypothetical protein
MRKIFSPTKIRKQVLMRYGEIGLVNKSLFVLENGFRSLQEFSIYTVIPILRRDLGTLLADMPE